MNIIKNILNIRSNLVSERPVPQFISMNITGRCNLKCEFCEKSQKISNSEIGLEGVNKLIDLGLKYDCPVFLGGGEPFMHKQIWDILSYSKFIGKKVSVVSNGTFLHSISPDKYELLNSCISVMSISIDSADSEQHDKIRGVKGTFDRVMKFLNNPQRKFGIGINCLLSPDLVNVQPMIEFAKDMKCSLNFQPVIFESNFPSLERIEWKENIKKKLSFSVEKMEMLRSLDKYAKKIGVMTNLPIVMKFVDKYFQFANTDKYFSDYVSNKFMCFTPFQQLNVDENGMITPCIFIAGKYSINDGDIYESWLKMALKYREILKRGEKYKVCKSCSCHFAENFRSSIISYPVANWNQLIWLFTYYTKRLIQKGGRKI